MKVPYCSYSSWFILFQALADEAEFVRDTALRAGQRIINLYSQKAIELLLPELEKGLFDDNWRIRLSSIQLLGDLLYRISGITYSLSNLDILFLDSLYHTLSKYWVDTAL